LGGFYLLTRQRLDWIFVKPGLDGPRDPAEPISDHSPITVDLLFHVPAQIHLTFLTRKHIPTYTGKVGYPSGISLRPAFADDLLFARTIYFDTMRWLIERLFGWDELREKEKFAAQFDVAASQIIVADGNDVGWVQAQEDEAALWLQSLYVVPAMQRRGIGTEVLRRLVERAHSECKPLTLSVVKINPAFHLYKRHGFKISHEDEYKFYMRLDPI
jgi:GNAT superfamily N-acetyltransferase